jgi:hypothetical protein
MTSRTTGLAPGLRRLNLHEAGAVSGGEIPPPRPWIVAKPGPPQPWLTPWLVLDPSVITTPVVIVLPL